jgi:hypothetical protein
VTLAASVMVMLSKLLLSEPKSAPMVLAIDCMRKLPLKFEDDDHVRLPSDCEDEGARGGIECER